MSRLTSNERTLAALPTTKWPDSAWNIDVRYDGKREGVTFTAHAHGAWNKTTKVYGHEEQFATFDEAVRWLAERLGVPVETNAEPSKYQRAVWFLQDIANMSRKVGSETAAHALAQLGEPRERTGD